MSYERRKGRRSSWDDLFGDFDDDFEEMRQRMDELMEQYMSGDVDISAEQPMIYGFSMRVGPDGKPRIQEFGNTAAQRDTLEEVCREPLTDIIEDKDTVRIIVEMPGVEKEDIDLNVEDRSLEIQVDKEERKFSKKLELPCAVDADSTKASYKNGVLEITLKKTLPKKRGRSVKIDSG